MDPFSADVVQVVQLAKDIIVSACAVGTVWIAYVGLSTWRREHVGRQEYDIARRLLLDVYRFREAIRAVRNPVMQRGEIKEAQGAAGSSRSSSSSPIAQEQPVYDFRWERVSEATAALKTTQLEAEVLLGKEEVRQCLSPLIPLANELSLAIRRYLRFRAQADEPTSDPVEHIEVERIVCEIGRPGSNSYTDRLEAAISAIEEFIRPHLR